MTGVAGPLDVMLTDYQSLRSEIKRSIWLQDAVTGIGIPILTILTTITLRILDLGASDIHFVAFAVAMGTPLLAFVVWSLWLMEMSRMMRAGNYLRLLEDRLNRELDAPALTWENWLRDQDAPVTDPHRIHHIAQVVIVAILLFVAVASLASAYAIVQGATGQSLLLGTIHPAAVQGVLLVYTLLLALLVFLSVRVIFHSKAGPVDYTGLEVEDLPGEDNYGDRARSRFFAWERRYLDRLTPKADGPNADSDE